MVIRKTIEFIETASPITEPITKFGGQPNWLDGPQWPISKRLNVPMRFICQIALTEDLFPGCAGKMAYIFMTDEREFAEGTWEPDSGENAVIIQPNGIPHVRVQSLADGPSLKVENSMLQTACIEFAVQLAVESDPCYINVDKDFDMSDEEVGMYNDAIAGNKIGGTPGFLQYEEFPDNVNDWLLLLQLDSAAVPFYVNFGDAGIAYAFINPEGTIGKFLWQCA